MKKLSEYTGSKAMELWADLLVPVTAVMNNPAVQEVVSNKGTVMNIVTTILRDNAKEAEAILKIIDPDIKINGFTLPFHIFALVREISYTEEFKSFFGSAPQVKTESEFSGQHTANIRETNDIF